MPYNPKIHRRRSIRLKGYDYSQPGKYFVTICLQNKACLFGQVVNGVMHLNDAGQMVEKWYRELENKFPDIQCREMVVMPNHFHAIIHNVGADLSVCPTNKLGLPNLLVNKNKMLDNQNTILGDSNISDKPEILGESQNTILGDSNISGKPEILGESNISDKPEILGDSNISGKPEILGESNISGKPEILGEHLGSPLHSVVQWFKTMSTNEYIRGVKNYNWPRFDGKLWQRNYWEHIIRNEKSYHNIAEYIINNPSKWDKDSLNLNPTDSEE